MKRSERLQVRLEPSEKAEIAERALDAGMKLSDFARHRLLGKRINRRERPKATPGVEANSEWEEAPLTSTHIAERALEVALKAARERS